MCTELLLEKIQMLTIGCLVLAVFNMILLICVVLQPFGSKIKSISCMCFDGARVCCCNANLGDQEDQNDRPAWYWRAMGY